jgi:hypothetical protein
MLLSNCKNWRVIISFPEEIYVNQFHRYSYMAFNFLYFNTKCFNHHDHKASICQRFYVSMVFIFQWYPEQLCSDKSVNYLTKYNIFFFLRMIYSSQTIGKAEERKQSEAITYAGHTNNLVSQSKLHTQNMVFFCVSI